MVHVVRGCTQAVRVVDALVIRFFSPFPLQTLRETRSEPEQRQQGFGFGELRQQQPGRRMFHVIRRQRQLPLGRGVLLRRLQQRQQPHGGLQRDQRPVRW